MCEDFFILLFTISDMLIGLQTLFFFSDSLRSSRLRFGRLGEFSMIPSSQITISSSNRTSHDFRFSRFLKRLNTERRPRFLAWPIGAIETVELTELMDESKSTSLIVDESKFY